MWVGPLLVREATGPGPVAELIRMVQAAAGEAGVAVLTANEQRAAALRAALARTSSRGRVPSVETCQGFAKRLLRWLDPRYRRGVRVVGPAERRVLMRDILRRLGFPATPAAIEHSLLALGRTKTQPGADVVSAWAASQQLELLRRYDRALKGRHAVDPDDLPSLPLRLLRHDPGRLAEARHRTGVVVIDDYTRLGPLDLELVTLLAQDNSGPIAIFSRPDEARLNRFRHDFPNAMEAVLPLARLPAAAPPAGVSAAAARRRVLATWPSGEERLVCYQASDELDESRFVAAEAARLCRGGVRPADIAAGYRLEATARELEEALQRASVPVSRVGWSADHETKDDVLAYLRLVANPDDDAAFTRALGRPARRIPAAALASLSQLAGSLKLSLNATVPHAAMLSSLPARTRTALRQFRTQLASWREFNDARPLVDVMDRVLEESGYLAWAQHRQAGRILDGQIDRLRLAAAEFERLEGRRWSRFVEAITPSAPPMDDAVHLVSWSQLAGRDYAVVFLTGLEDGAVPHDSALADPTALEAERSSFEAATAQARMCTFLSYALMRTMEGKLVVRDPSRFLRETPAPAPFSA